MNKRILLLLVEDNRLLREGIATLVSKHDDIRLINVLGTNEAILEKLRTLKPNVLLLDFGLRSLNSLQLVKTAVATYPETKVIVMDLVPSQEDVLDCIRAGVSGFILKDATLTDFLKTIRSVAQGTKVLPSLLTSSLFSQIINHATTQEGGKAPRLMESVRMTGRERQIVMLVSDGMTNKEIAQRLHLSTYTVKGHVHNILEKLALHTRIQIANYAHDTEGFKDMGESDSPPTH